jgi:hypothetical protein
VHEVTLAHPLSAYWAAELGLETIRDYAIGEVVAVNEFIEAKLIAAGYVVGVAPTVPY